MSLESRVEAVFGSGTSLALATSAIDELLAGESQEPLLAFISKLVANACTDSRMPSHIARPAMMHLARGVKALSGAALETAATHMLAALKAQSVAFDEAEFVLRDALFEYLVSTGEYAEAAAVLAAVNLESTSRVFSDAEKVDILVKISEVYLEDRDHVEKAETFVSKAAPIMNSIADVALQLRYRTTSARVLDLNRKFVDAAQRFYELSTMTTANIEAGDLLELLGKALTCAVLGRVGAQRTRVMALLSKDPRLEQLSDLPLYASHAAVLLKMFNEQILMHSELLAFEASLMPHQKSVRLECYVPCQCNVCVLSSRRTGSRSRTRRWSSTTSWPSGASTATYTLASWHICCTWTPPRLSAWRPR